MVAAAEYPIAENGYVKLIYRYIVCKRTKLHTSRMCEFDAKQAKLKGDYRVSHRAK